MVATEVESQQSTVLYSPKDNARIRNLLALQLGFMSFMGQAPYVLDKFIPRFLSGFGWYVTRLYSVFVISQTLHTAILFFKTTFDMLNRGELDAITDALTQAIITAYPCFSTCYWLWHSTSLQKCIAHLNRSYWHHSMAGLTFVSIYPAYMLARRITICWLCVALTGISLFGFAPLIQGTRTLPLKCWYPFDALHPDYYVAVYVTQMFTQVNIGVTFACGSALYVSLVILMLGQFDVLYSSLKNLHFHIQLRNGENLPRLRKLQAKYSTDTDELNQYLFCEEEQTDLTVFEKIRFNEASKKRMSKLTLHDSFVKCIKLHQFICDCCNMIENLFYPYCLVKSLQITIQLCLLVFVGVAGERSLMRIFNLFQYCAMTVVELLMFTYCGELLQQHSVRSGEAFWRSPWYSTYMPIRKDIFIFLINSKRALRLTAGKFYVMDVQRLRSVVAQAFSFFTLLQKLAAKNVKK